MLQEYIYTGSDNLEECDWISYGDIQPAEHSDKIDLVGLPFTGGSDYSGSTSDKANHQWIVENYGHHPALREVFGGYGTYDVVFIASLLNEETRGELEDLANDLEKYPVLDDDTLHQLEQEIIDEAWGDYLASDIKRDAQGKLDHLPDHIIRELAEQFEFWPEIEQYNAHIFNQDKLIDKLVQWTEQFVDDSLTVDDLLDLLPTDLDNIHLMTDPTTLRTLNTLALLIQATEDNDYEPSKLSHVLTVCSELTWEKQQADIHGDSGYINKLIEQL